MTDLNLLTVRALRELAKKHLGTGYSRLKTKAELIAALSKVMPKESKPAPKAAAPTKPSPEPKAAPIAPKPPIATAKPVVEAPKPAKKLEPEVKAEAAKPPAPAKPVVPPEPAVVAAKPPAKRAKGSQPEAPKVTRIEELASKYAENIQAFKPLPQEPKPVFPALKPVAAASRPGASSITPPVVVAKPSAPAPKPSAPSPAPSSPVAKGTVVAAEPAPVAPKTAEVEETESEPIEPAPVRAAPPKPRVISAAEQALLDENLGDLPPSYLDDDVTLLARDPHTLWVAWDFARQTERRAHEGMSHAVPTLRLFDGARLAREVEISLEARSWYLYNVVPGHQYRAEIHFVAPAGKTKQLGPASNPMTVPPEGPSPVIDTHFVRLPLALPPLRPVPPLPKPHLAPPFPIENVEALMDRAERALREELPAMPPLPVSANGVVARAVTKSAGADRVVPQASRKKRGAVKESEVVVQRWKGSSDLTVERYRQWIAGEEEEIPANLSEQKVTTSERTRFGGRWTSSRPA